MLDSNHILSKSFVSDAERVPILQIPQTASSKGWRGNCHPGELGMALRKLGFKRERRWDAVVAFVLCGINKDSESCGRGEV
jgi:hypothetical protein